MGGGVATGARTEAGEHVCDAPTMPSFPNAPVLPSPSRTVYDMKKLIDGIGVNKKISSAKFEVDGEW